MTIEKLKIGNMIIALVAATSPLLVSCSFASERCNMDKTQETLETFRDNESTLRRRDTQRQGLSSLNLTINNTNQPTSEKKCCKGLKCTISCCCCCSTLGILLIVGLSIGVYYLGVNYNLFSPISL